MFFAMLLASMGTFVDMAEIFGNGGDSVSVGGQYECSECGHRIHLNAGDTFPADHHPEKPWTLYVRDEQGSTQAK